MLSQKTRKLQEKHGGMMIIGKKKLRVEPSDSPELLKLTLDEYNLIDTIELNFENFDDGRGYTQAYLLSKRWGFKGEIIGINAHIDQLQFMIRSGCTGYRLQEQYKGLDEKEYLDTFSICYQAAPNNSGLIETFNEEE